MVLTGSRSRLQFLAVAPIYPRGWSVWGLSRVYLSRPVIGIPENLGFGGSGGELV
jgi:hypothetical protein